MIEPLHRLLVRDDDEQDLASFLRRTDRLDAHARRRSGQRPIVPVELIRRVHYTGRTRDHAEVIPRRGNRGVVRQRRYGRRQEERIGRVLADETAVLLVERQALLCCRGQSGGEQREEDGRRAQDGTSHGGSWCDGYVSTAGCVGLIGPAGCAAQVDPHGVCP